MNILKKWIDVLATPKAALKKEGKSKKLNEALLHIAVAGVIVGIISGLFPNADLMEAKTAFGETMFLVWMIVITPIFFILFWGVSAVVLYVFAKFLNGKGTLVPHAHIIALVNAPFGVLNNLAEAVPTIGGVLSVVVTVYSLYVLTLAMKEVHKYSTSRAVFTWLVPLVLLVLVIVFLAFLGLFGLA